MSESSRGQEKIGRIEATLEILKDSVEDIQSDMKEISSTLSVNTQQLEIHIAGVQLAREQNDLLKRDVDARLSPIQEHVTQVRFLGKLLIWLLPLMGLPASIYYIVQVSRMMSGK